MARGTLRDALGGLRNLAELLHSVRVGPKALTTVLPDVAASAISMEHAVDELLGQVSALPDFGPASSELRGCFGLGLERLRDELDQAMARPLTARSRLGLEQTVTELSLELDTARGLLELLAEATTQRTVHVRLRELIHESFSGPPSGGSWKRGSVAATLAFEHDEVELDVNPRVATALFALGVEYAVASGVDSPCVRVSGRSRGFAFQVSAEPGCPGEDVHLAARGVIGPTLACLGAAAKLSGIALDWASEARRLTLEFPARAS